MLCVSTLTLAFDVAVTELLILGLTSWSLSLSLPLLLSLLASSLKKYTFIWDILGTNVRTWIQSLKL